MNDSHKNLLFETSPYANLDAIVEHDQRVVYFYLNSRSPQRSTFATKACWVCNLRPGPLVINQQEMQQGIPPQLPRTHCHERGGRDIPATDSLQVVWFEEGNGAALLEDERILAVIPPWSGLDGFHGYASGCAAQSPVCWPMPAGDDNPLLRRISAAQQFWTSCQSADNHPFGKLQKHLLQFYEDRFGPAKHYFSIDGGNFPPRGLAQFEQDQKLVLTTVAMSLCAQPNVELYVDQPSWYRRIELGIQLETPIGESELERLRQQLSGSASFPWNNLTWLGHGHSISFDFGFERRGQAMNYAVLVSDTYLQESMPTDETAKDRPPNSLPTFRNDPINLLWLVPIGETQRNQLQSGELTVDSLLHL